MSVPILIVVTHLLGAGHLTRAAAIAREAAQAGHRVTLVSGGRPVPLIDTTGVELVQLPPVAATAADLRTLRTLSGEAAGAEHMAARRVLLLDTLERVRPEIVVTELFPFGRRSLAAEFTALIEAAEALRPRPRIASSIRDILVRPEKAAKVERAHALIARHYDRVLVHADPALVRLDASWPVDAALASRLLYTGYVDGEPDLPASGDAEVVVSGGSSEAGLPVYRAAMGAAAMLPDRRWLVLLGGGVAEQDAADLRAAAGPNVTVEPARREFRALLAGADAFVGQSGYNTTMDILASGVRTVLVPFERGGETEQRLRADRLAAAGLATVLTEAKLGAATLAARVRAALASPPPPANRIDRAGAARTAALLADLARNRDGLAERRP